MKESFEVLWAAVAEFDLLGIVAFIADQNPEAARDVLRRIKSSTGKLDQSPLRGRVVPELLKQGLSRYREIVIKPWRVIYLIEERKVYVVSLIDGRRNVEDILLSRFLR